MWRHFKSYMLNVVIAGDVLANVICGGMIGETISARTGRNARDGWRWAIWLDWVLSHSLSHHHGHQAILHDAQRAQAVWDREAAYFIKGPRRPR